MGNQYIDISRDIRNMLTLTVCNAIGHEHGDAVKLHTVNSDAACSEIVTVVIQTIDIGIIQAIVVVAGNEYLIECVKDKVLNDVIHTNVIDYRNKEKINETFNRMKELYGYKSENNNQNSGKYENEMVGKMISESKEKLFVKQDTKKNQYNPT